jgi:tripartite-type tricarboxylate transporter receptor subunit TctC
LGKHVDLVAGGGQHIGYVKQEILRMFVLVQTDKRDPNSPDVLTPKGLECGDIPLHGYVVMGARGLPNAVCKKLGEVFKKVVEGPDFQRLLQNSGDTSLNSMAKIPLSQCGHRAIPKATEFPYITA